MVDPIKNKAVHPNIAGNGARRLVELARDESLPANVRDEFRKLADLVLKVGEHGLSLADRERLTHAVSAMWQVIETKEHV